MPSTRKTKASVIKEQKKLITTRLMQISLIVDNYVYKNAPISEESAVSFINEVNSYKDKCYEDRPTLQVIEKLVRCMTGIIAEQQGCDPAADNNVSVEKNLPAPLVDQDLTQFTQITLFDNNKSNELHTSNDKVNTNKKNFKDNNINEDIHLQKAISKLSIEDDELLSITVINSPNIQNCSQSILTNFECINDINISLDTNKIISNKNTENVIHTSSLSNNRILRSNSQIKTKAPAKRRKVTKPLQDSVSNAKTNKSVTKNSQRSVRRNKTEANANKELSNEKTIQNYQKNKSAKISYIMTNNPENNCMVIKDTFTKQTKISTSPAEMYQESHCTQAKDYSKTDLKLTNDLQIYNENVEYDLSWIENIRFVREVTEDESIPTSIEDSFWENCTLPDNWTNDNFLYT